MTLDYKDLFQQTTACYWLRSTRGTTSCKMSALLYILLHLDEVTLSCVPMIKKIIKDINGSHGTELKQILSNRSVNGTLIKDTSFLTGHMWYVGLVKKSQDLSLPGDVIDHYFVIVQDKDGTFKTVSSYGCSLVYMEQYETTLKRCDFDAFIKALQQTVKTRATKQVIRDFMIKHFLHLDHYVEKDVDPDENEGRTTTMPHLRDAEVEGYVTSNYHMEFYPIMDTLQTMWNAQKRSFKR